MGNFFIIILNIIMESFYSLCCGCWRPKNKVELNKKPVEFLDKAKGSMNLKYTGDKNEEFATFGAGCYWGTEKWFISKFKHADAITGYAVGFMSPDHDAPVNPTYR